MFVYPSYAEEEKENILRRLSLQSLIFHFQIQSRDNFSNVIAVIHECVLNKTRSLITFPPFFYFINLFSLSFCLL